MIAIGRGHGGVELEDYLVGVPRAMGVAVRDCGTHGKASVDPSTRASALAGGSCSGFRPTGLLEDATVLALGLHSAANSEGTAVQAMIQSRS
jgi:hypothetical protein